MNLTQDDVLLFLSMLEGRARSGLHNIAILDGWPEQQRIAVLHASETVALMRKLCEGFNFVELGVHRLKAEAPEAFAMVERLIQERR